MYKLIIIVCEDEERDVEKSVYSLGFVFNCLEDVMEFIKFFEQHTDEDMNTVVFEIIFVELKEGSDL